MLAVVFGEIGSVQGIGMGMGTSALGEWYGGMVASISGERNGRGLGELVCEEGT